MRLLPTGKRRHPVVWGIVVALLVSLLAFPALSAFFSTPFAGFFTRAATGLYDRFYWLHASRLITASELASLQTTIRQFAVDRKELEDLKIQNAQLREELGFVRRTAAPFVAADILAKSVQNTSSRFVVNVGSKQGIRVGDPVVSGEGLLVGKVAEVMPGASTVASLTDPSHVTAVSLVNEHATIGIARGIQGDLLSISFIPLEEIVSVNDLIVTSGLESGVPSGLIVGVINAVTQDPTSLFQSAVVEPLSDMRRLSSVLILLQENP